MQIEERKYPTLEDAASSLATDLVATLSEAICNRSKALLAVSGGKTPKKVFNFLRKQELDWNNVTLTLTDERWVSNKHQESNEQMVRTNLLKYLSSDVTFLPLYSGLGTLKGDVLSCEARLRTLSLPFDAVYLGIGADGHFASLFPGDDALNISDSLCVGVAGTDSRLSRISLTASTILNSRKIYILFSGEMKHLVYKKAKIPGSYCEIPIRLILSQTEIPVFVYSAP